MLFSLFILQKTREEAAQMLQLTKSNIVEYVASRLDFFNPHGDIKVSEIGEGTVEEDGDGFINFVFRVSDGCHPLIV